MYLHTCIVCIEATRSSVTSDVGLGLNGLIYCLLLILPIWQIIRLNFYHFFNYMYHCFSLIAEKH